MHEMEVMKAIIMKVLDLMPKKLKHIKNYITLCQICTLLSCFSFGHI